MSMPQRRSGAPTPFGNHSDSSQNGELGDIVAERWYWARTAGWNLRQRATQWLNTHPPDGGRLGGAYPDPLEENCWSRHELIETAAQLLGISIVSASEQSMQRAEANLPALPRRWTRRAWINIVPNASPVLEIRPFFRNDEMAYFGSCFQVAMVLAFLCLDEGGYEVLSGSSATGYFAGDIANANNLTRYHQFAKALINVKGDCPQDWGCHCNYRRKEYNQPPPDHLQPTDAFMWQKIVGRLDHPEQAEHPIVRGPRRTNVLPFSNSDEPRTVWSTNPNLGNLGDDTPPDPRRGRRTGA